MTVFTKSNAGPHNRGMFSKANGAMSNLFHKGAVSLRQLPGHLDTVNNIIKKGIEVANNVRAAAPVAAEIGALML